MRIEEAVSGTRVRYTKDKIDDVPKGTMGTVVACTSRGKSASVIVIFDGIEANRYMRRSELALVR